MQEAAEMLPPDEPAPDAHSDRDTDMTGVEEDLSLRAWWASADAATRTRHRVISDDNVQLHKAITTANKFMVDAELEHWVEEQNVKKGISPAPGVLITRANEIKSKHGVPAPTGRKGCRKWMARWRRRRAAQLRSLPTRERISREEKHLKVIGYVHHLQIGF